MIGLLNVNKPAGWTSRDVVNRVEKLVRPGKAGHAGTLDPLATGVLAVCVGPATRLVEHVQAGRKHYRATFLLARESDTEDVSGRVTLLPDAPIPTSADLEAALESFRGPQLQRPPAYSALKVKGKRAHQLARQGQQVELAPRSIEIFALRLVGFAYPEFVLDIECSSGTYVRSLGRDLAVSMGTGAVMSGLVRTKVGPFAIEDAVELDALESSNIASHLHPAAVAVAHLPQLEVHDHDVHRIVQGKQIETTIPLAGAEVAAMHAGRLVAILERRGELWHPAEVFPERG